jgi:hypothetical protein
VPELVLGRKGEKRKRVLKEKKRMRKKKSCGRR